MTANFAYHQSSDLRPQLRDVGIRHLDVERLLGRWLNTNEETRGLQEIYIEQSGDVIHVRAAAAGTDVPIEWPATPASVVANLEDEAGQQIAALMVVFEFGFMQTQIQIRVNKGVLVLVLFTVFKDGSGRSNYVTREFFSRARE